jgi:hypothetical protein
VNVTDVWTLSCLLNFPHDLRRGLTSFERAMEGDGRDPVIEEADLGISDVFL